MRHGLATLYVATLLGGCSLLYNPNNIPAGEIDAAIPDAEVIFDADPTMLVLEKITPGTLIEGQGHDGSRRAVIVIHGQHIVNDGTTVTIVAAQGATKTPVLVFDSAELEIDGNGRRLALPITVPVDPDLDRGETIALDVTVTQTSMGGQISRTLTGGLVLQGLDELDAGDPELANGFPGGLSEYARVELTSGTVRRAGGVTEPIRIRSMSSLAIAAGVTITVDASTTLGGPGGGDGGTGGTIVGGAGTQGSGPAGGAVTTGAGMPGGFGGNSQLTTLAAPNRGSGGAGGNGGALARGGDGGGGGGSIELSALGDLSVGDVTARGAQKEAGMFGYYGGGGSGGIIFLRAGGNLDAGVLDVSGQPTAGRARFDAGGSATVTNGASHHRGPMFANLPLITTDERPQITVTGGPLTEFRYFITNDDGSDARDPVVSTIAENGSKVFTPKDPLYPGLNQICLLVDGAELTSDTRNCVHLVHLYRP